MASGVPVRDDCLNVYQDLKLKKKYKAIFYVLGSNNTEIQIEKTFEKLDYDDFVGSLPADDCRYAIYDFEYEKAAGDGTRNKICFIVWAPDTAPVKKKMLYASSKDALRKKLVGIAAEIQATDFSEVAYDTVLERVSRGA